MPSRKSKYSKDVLEPIIASSISWADVIRKLGLRQTGGTQQQLRERAKVLGISTAHFKGQKWAVGHTSDTHPSIKRVQQKISYSDDEMFSRGVLYSPSRQRRRLLQLGHGKVCEKCGLTEWLGDRIVLHLDHVDGDRTNNLKENLRFLCPNCHQQTPTWGKASC